MGGAVSSGRDNGELIDNLMGGNYIRTRSVERVFRALDRADYMTPEARDQAYKDLAWRNGPLHMSAPCIYSEVMEGLELKPGLSFLNVGSGTGYLSTLVGLILGSSGINHGVEVHPVVVDYSNKKMSQFMENSPTLDEFDFCEPKFYCGNGLCVAPLQTPYDRVYCGAGCPEEYQNYFKQLIKVGGILVMPLNDNLLQVKRVKIDDWRTRSLLNVSFATLRVPSKEEAGELVRLEEQTPSRLQVLARARVRACMRGAMRRRHPALREPPPRAPPAKKACPRRICIPIEDDSDAEGLNALHDLDRASGANEMNALLSLVLSMGQNRVAGALRVDPLDSPTDSSDDSLDDDDDDDDDAGDRPDSDGAPVAAPNRVSQSNPESDREENSDRAQARNVIMFEFLDNTESNESNPTPNPNTTTDSNTTDNTSKDTRTDDQKDEEDVPNVPSEVEIYLGKASEAPGTSTMEWHEPESKRDRSSDEETTESSKTKEEKRQKFDSGIGEENTPSSGSSPGKKSEESDGSQGTASLTDDAGVDGGVKGRRRQKRGHSLLSTRSSSSTDDENDDEGGTGSGTDPPRRRPKRRAGDGGDARRVRLSTLMKRGVKELPLPYALKKYVNLGRCFEF